MSNVIDLTTPSHHSSYYLFHPWSEEIPEDERCTYWVSFVALSLITAFVVPLLYYITYYTIQGLSSLCGRASNANIHTQQRAIPPREFKLAEEQTLYDLLKQEIALTETIDRGPTNLEWQEFDGSWDETLEEFTHWSEGQDHKPLYIQLVGKFSKADLKIVRMTMEFLKVFHRVDVHLVDTILSINELETESGVAITHKQTDWGNQQVSQFLTNDAIKALSAVQKHYASEQSHYIAFTSEFLYSSLCDGFVFGSALHEGTGIFSNFLFGSAQENFRSVVARMMKIAAHEFGHMYSISHCTAHECNIGGYISLCELDSRPFYYCSKDTAKLCLLKGINMKHYYTDLLAYFLSFKKTHSTDFFDKDIRHVQQKLEILEANPQLYSTEMGDLE